MPLGPGAGAGAGARRAGFGAGVERGAALRAGVARCAAAFGAVRAEARFAAALAAERGAALRAGVARFAAAFGATRFFVVRFAVARRADDGRAGFDAAARVFADLRVVAGAVAARPADRCFAVFARGDEFRRAPAGRDAAFFVRLPRRAGMGGGLREDPVGYAAGGAARGTEVRAS